MTIICAAPCRENSNTLFLASSKAQRIGLMFSYRAGKMTQMMETLAETIPSIPHTRPSLMAQRRDRRAERTDKMKKKRSNLKNDK